MEAQGSEVPFPRSPMAVQDQREIHTGAQTRVPPLYNASVNIGSVVQAGCSLVGGFIMCAFKAYTHSIETFFVV